MKARPQPLKNFSGGGGGQIGVDETPSKNVDFDCIMKAFFVECNNGLFLYFSWLSFPYKIKCNIVNFFHIMLWNY